MVNPHVAYERQKAWLRTHGVEREDQLRMIAYTVPWTRPAEPVGGDPGTNVPQAFPNGATLVLLVLASCIPTGEPDNPFVGPFDRFRIRFQYNANQSGLVVGNPSDTGGLGSTVFGPFGDQFPAREIPLEANDVINATVQNVTPEVIRGNITYHCLIWRQGQ
jgi:hypothetical protein